MFDIGITNIQRQDAARIRLDRLREAWADEDWQLAWERTYALQGKHERSG